jgi:hypothetical protein
MARIFGLFAEDIVRLWTRLPDDLCPYRDIGRPSFYLGGSYAHLTYDFAFQKRDKNWPEDEFWLGELKAWVDFEGGRHARLAQPEADTCAGKIGDLICGKEARVNGVPKRCTGVVLVWPCADPIALNPPLMEVIELERVIRDLNTPCAPGEFGTMLAELEGACARLFCGIKAFR